MGSLVKKVTVLGLVSVSLVGCSSGASEEADTETDNGPDIEGSKDEAQHVDEFDVDFKDNEDFENVEGDIMDEEDETSSESSE